MVIFGIKWNISLRKENICLFVFPVPCNYVDGTDLLVIHREGPKRQSHKKAETAVPSP